MTRLIVNIEHCTPALYNQAIKTASTKAWKTKLTHRQTCRKPTLLNNPHTDQLTLDTALALMQGHGCQWDNLPGAEVSWQAATGQAAQVGVNAGMS